MTKLNPILDAMSNIDDNIVTNTKKRKKRPLLIAVAVAAALMLLMGAAVVNEYLSTKDISVNGESLFELNYWKQENVNFLTRGEFLDMGAAVTEDSGRYIRHELETLPSEVFQIHNIPSLINDNFIEESSTVKVGYFYVPDEEVTETTVPEMVKLEFPLTDKTNGAQIKLDVLCMLKDDVNYSIGIISVVGDNRVSKYQKVDYELLTLNDGSQAVIYPFGGDEVCANFTYKGIVYDLSIDDEAQDIGRMRQVLLDLGVL